MNMKISLYITVEIGSVLRACAWRYRGRCDFNSFIGMLWMIHLFSQHLYNFSYVPGTVLNTEMFNYPTTSVSPGLLIPHITNAVNDT